MVDGDTIKVSIAGTTYTVRYIGIDTPETVDPNSPVMWMGPEASSANEQLVAGQTVTLERDVSETDRFGRLLRYVWLPAPDGWLLVNEELVRLGYASSSSYPPDVRYQDRFVAAQREAADGGRGLWGPTPAPQPTPSPAPRRYLRRAAATRATPASAFRRPRRTSTAVRSPSAGSRSWLQTPMASTVITTVSGARADEHSGSLSNERSGSQLEHSGSLQQVRSQRLGDSVKMPMRRFPTR